MMHLTIDRYRLTRVSWLLIVAFLGCYHRPVTVGVPVGEAGGSGTRGSVNNPLDPTGLYTRAGFIAQSEPLPFVGTLRYFGARSADSTLVLLTLSLANRALTFTSDGEGQRATYGVAIDVRQGSATTRHLDSHETVRVASYKETSRGDESIIYQRFFNLAPGQFILALVVRDDGSARTSSQETMVIVPRLGRHSLSSPVTVYQATGRMSMDSLPRLVTNPRSTVVFGRDSSAQMYLEGYDLAANSRVIVSAFSEKAIVWRDTITLTPHGNLDAATFALPTSRVGVGQLSVVATLSEATDTVRSPLFVSFGDEWAIGSLDEMLNYLRYFATPERLKVLREAPSDERALAWAAFWRETDPIPSTPEHEGLRDYFNRLQQANVRFRNEAASGWLTDRGKVFITLGEPDQILEQGESNQINGRGRAQIWSYYQHHLQLVFIDQTGFGHWRLTTSSDGEFERVARRERVH